MNANVNTGGSAIKGDSYVPQKFDFVSRVHDDGVINPLSCMLILSTDESRLKAGVYAWHGKRWNMLDLSFDDLNEYIKQTNAKILRQVEGEYKPQNCDVLVVLALDIPNFNNLRYIFDYDDDYDMFDVYTWRSFLPVEFPRQVGRWELVKMVDETDNLLVYRVVT